MDPVIQQTPKDLFRHMEERELAELIRLLELARKECGDGRTAVSCNGTNDPDRVGCVEKAV
jgi:hypothetical protein